MEASRMRRRSLVGVVLACVVVGCLLLAVGLDPGSGTATNLQAADDAASLVVGAHHAKTVPTPGAAVVGALLAALGALFVIVLAHPAPASSAQWTIEPGYERFPRQLVPWAARAWRAPPLPARA